MEHDTENSLSEHIIAFLCSAKSSRAYYDLLREQRIARHKKSVVRSTLSRLEKKGFISQNKKGWNTTQKGKTYLSCLSNYDYIPSPFQEHSPGQRIVAFDIPEAKRRERVWLRNQLKIFGYKMLQRSLWQGPSDLPKEFYDRLKKLGIASGVKTFTVIPK